jgi:hypothetical protein
MYYAFGGGGVVNLRSTLHTAGGGGGGVKGKIKIVNLIFTDVLDHRRLFCRHGKQFINRQALFNTFVQ